MSSTSTFCAELGRALTICALAMAPACDSNDQGSGAPQDAKEEEEASTNSKAAAKVDARVSEIKETLAEGENAKYACVGALSSNKALASSSDASEKRAYAALEQVCHVEQPKALIAAIRKKIDAGEELKSTETASLKTVINGKGFPTEGEPVKVAADAKRLMDIEIPAYQIKLHLSTAKQELESGKKVSMGCIKAKQVIKKAGTALEGDEAAKPVLSAYAETCPKS